MAGCHDGMDSARGVVEARRVQCKSRGPPFAHPPTPSPPRDHKNMSPCRHCPPPPPPPKKKNQNNIFCFAAATGSQSGPRRHRGASEARQVEHSSAWPVRWLLAQGLRRAFGWFGGDGVGWCFRCVWFCGCHCGGEWSSIKVCRRCSTAVPI